MKKIISFFLFSLVLAELHGQELLNFEKLDPLPFATRGMAYAQSEDDIFIYGGRSEQGAFSDHFQIYDTQVGKWYELDIAELPLARNASAVYLNDFRSLLVAGGIKPFGRDVGFTDSLRLINIDDLSVTALGAMPVFANKVGITKRKNVVFFFGGTKEVNYSVNQEAYYKFTDQFYYYNLENGHVQQLPALPKAMETKGRIYKDLLFVFGGFDGDALNSVYSFDLNDLEWNKIKPLKKAINNYALAQYQNYFILVGGDLDPDQLIIYDAESQTAEYFKMNFKGRDMGAAVIKDHLYVFGGSSIDRLQNLSSDRLYRLPLSKLLPGAN